MVLADTLSLDGTPDTGYFTQVTNLAILWNFFESSRTPFPLTWNGNTEMFPKPKEN
jgi:hypothetical protein